MLPGWPIGPPEGPIGPYCPGPLGPAHSKRSHTQDYLHNKSEALTINRID